MLTTYRSRTLRLGHLASLVVAIGLACAMSAATAHRADAIAVFDSGQGQYGWITPFSTPNDSSHRIKTQGRCAEGHSGQMYFRDGNQQALLGPVHVPSEWRFSDGYGFQVPAGLAPGDYDVYVDCGNWNQIIINAWITGPGTLAQLLDYRDGVAPAGSTPVVTVPPVATPAPAQDSDVYVTDGAASSGSSRSPRSSASRLTAPPATPETPAAAPPVTGDAPVTLETTISPDTSPTTAPKSFVAIDPRPASSSGDVAYGVFAAGLVVVGMSIFSAVRRRRITT